MDDGQAEQSPEPNMAGRGKPNCNRAIGSHEDSVLGVHAMEPTAHIVHAGAETGECFRFEIDVAEINRASSCRRDQPAALPVDPGITDGTFGVVPNRQIWTHRVCQFF